MYHRMDKFCSASASIRGTSSSTTADIFGDGVNVAARLEALAAPGGICISGRVQEDLQGKLNVVSEDIGEQQLKNINRPVRAYRIRPCLQEPRSTEAQREPLDRLQPSSVPVRLRNWLNSSRSRLVIIAGLGLAVLAISAAYWLLAGGSPALLIVCR